MLAILGSRRIRGKGGHQIGQGKQDAEDGKEHRADDVEHQVDDSSTFGAAAGADGGQDRSDTGTDILAKEDEHRTGKAVGTACGQSLEDAH